jgi:hypothetical protein
VARLGGKHQLLTAIKASANRRKMLRGELPNQNKPLLRKERRAKDKRKKNKKRDKKKNLKRTTLQRMKVVKKMKERKS